MLLFGTNGLIVLKISLDRSKANQWVGPGHCHLPVVIFNYVRRQVLRSFSNLRGESDLHPQFILIRSLMRHLHKSQPVIEGYRSPQFDGIGP